MPEKIRLNIGAGESNLPGFIALDIKSGTDASERLPYEDGTVDEVYASHSLEHIHHSKIHKTIKEWCRVLKPDGRIRICVPDFEGIVEEFRQGKMGPEMLSAWLYGSRDESTDRHQSFITPEQLTQLLRFNAIDDIRSFTPDQPDCSTNPNVLPRSLNIEGFKRRTVVPREPVVAMVLSVPRLGFNDMFTGAIQTAKELGWHYMLSGGTEWGKGLTQAVMEMLEKSNPDYIMCLDYDSVFTAADARELLRLMQEHPEYGAIYPVEAHRHGDVPLGFATDGEVVYQGELTEVGSGHFGCTMIRRQVFEKLPQPWFISLPDPNTGLWSKQNIDADITFWAAMGLHGFKIAQANDVQIGHMELCVKWVKPNGIIWQPIQNYRSNGKPPNAKFDGDYWSKINNSIVARKARAEKAVATSPPITTNPNPPEPPPPPQSPELDTPPPDVSSRPVWPVGDGMGHKAPAHAPKNRIQSFPDSSYFAGAVNGQR